MIGFLAVTLKPPSELAKDGVPLSINVEEIVTVSPGPGTLIQTKTGDAFVVTESYTDVMHKVNALLITSRR